MPLRTDYTQRYSSRREPLTAYFACEAKEKKTNIQCNHKLKAVIIYFWPDRYPHDDSLVKTLCSPFNVYFHYLLFFLDVLPAYIPVKTLDRIKFVYRDQITWVAFCCGLLFTHVLCLHKQNVLPSILSWPCININIKYK